MHVKRDSASTLHPIELNRVRWWHRPLFESSSNGLGNRFFRSADIRQPVDAFGQVVHFIDNLREPASLAQFDFSLISGSLDREISRHYGWPQQIETGDNTGNKAWK